MRGTLSISRSGVRLNTSSVMKPSKSHLVFWTHSMALGHLTNGLLSLPPLPPPLELFIKEDLLVLIHQKIVIRKCKRPETEAEVEILRHLSAVVSLEHPEKMFPAWMMESEKPGPESELEETEEEERGQRLASQSQEAGTGDHCRCSGSCPAETESASQGPGVEDSEQSERGQPGQRDKCWRIRQSNRVRYPGSPSPAPPHSSSWRQSRSTRRPGASWIHRDTAGSQRGEDSGMTTLP